VAAWNLPLQPSHCDRPSVCSGLSQRALTWTSNSTIFNWFIESLASAMQRLCLFFVLIASLFWSSPSRAQDQVEQCAVRSSPATSYLHRLEIGISSYWSLFAKIVLVGLRLERKRHRMYLIELALSLQEHIVHRPPECMHLQIL
jgi:hypothetical protein